MKSGLYAWAGASATDSAAACAKRFDAPMTNWSKVYRGFSVPAAHAVSLRGGATRLGQRELRGLVVVCFGGPAHGVDEELDVDVAAGGIAQGVVEQAAVAGPDPLARDRAGNGEDEDVVFDTDAHARFGTTRARWLRRAGSAALSRRLPRSRSARSASWCRVMSSAAAAARSGLSTGTSTDVENRGRGVLPAPTSPRRGDFCSAVARIPPPATLLVARAVDQRGAERSTGI